MSVFKHSYSGLITGGLGMPACCGLITMGFHLFKCTIEVIIPPPIAGGGGGGSFVVNGFTVPYTTGRMTQSTRFVLITVNVGEQKWRRSYVVDRTKADIIVRISKLIDRIRNAVAVTVSGLQKAKRRVTAVFKRKDN